MEYVFLILNCGSSSVKFAFYTQTELTLIEHGAIENIGNDNGHLTLSENDALSGKKLGNITHDEALNIIIKHIEQHGAQTITAIGHRVVHGGNIFNQATVINQQNLHQLLPLNSLAPLHNPTSSAVISRCLQQWQHIPNIAVFDTAFHTSIPEHIACYAIDHQLSRKYGIKKYGFHGISHDYITQRYAETHQKPAPNLIIAHLGNGASICAVKAGKSIDISMGFTPLSGLIMGTRCGDIDPGLLQFIMNKLDIDLPTMIHQLNKESGMLGLSGASYDMRIIEKAYNAGDTQAIIAMHAYCYQAAKYIASYFVPLQQCDAIVFTAGIGEHSALVRRLILENLAYKGILLCNKDNHQHGNAQHVITQTGSTIPVMVLKTDEEKQIAIACQTLIEKKV